MSSRRRFHGALVNRLLLGNLTGRFLRVDEPIPSGSKILQRAVEDQWTDGWDRGARIRAGWCTGEEPHSGDIVNEEFPCAYGVDDGIALFWLQEEERPVPASEVKRQCHLRAFNRFGRPFNRLGSRDRTDLKDDVQADLAMTALPKRRVVLLVGLGEERWLLILRKSQDDMGRYMQILSRALGQAPRAHPVLWDPLDEDAPGWHSMTMALLMHLSSGGGAELASDVVLTEIRLATSDLRVRSLDPGGSHGELIRVAASMNPPPQVQQLFVDVHQGGEITSLVLDPGGFLSGDPPTSVGGLFGDGVRRRVLDVVSATERAGEVLAEIEREITERASDDTEKP